MTPWAKEVPPLADARVTVMGLGLFGGGVGVTRHLVRAGARVTVTDLRPEEELAESVRALDGCAVELRLGEHRKEDFRNADLVVVNPAVPGDSPWLREARLLESELNLFLKLCPAKRIVGVTGSNGKTTTTSLAAEMIRESGERVHLGGNIGGSLLDSVEEMSPDDVVVLELSSFQLDHLRVLDWSPTAAAILNLTPNHLDRHGTMENYVAAKREIFAHQAAGDWKILNEEDSMVMSLAAAAPSRNLLFGTIPGKERFRVTGPEGERVFDATGRRIPGRFNLANMAAAAALSLAATGGGNRWETAVEETCRTFPGVPHRLEFVAEKRGVRYYNDSIATSPESTVAALETLPGPIVLIVGGYDKNLPMEGLARTIAGKARTVVAYGDTGPRIAQLVKGRGPEVVSAEGFDDALRLAGESTSPGDTLLLSPACASYDLFRNFVERGDRFRDWVSGL